MARYICEGCAKAHITEEQYKNQKARCDDCYRRYLHISIPHIKKTEKKRQFIEHLKTLQRKKSEEIEQKEKP